jgi:hypothetical protein
VQLNFAMLEILTKRPGGWATLDELCRDIATAPGQEASSRFSGICGVDVLEAGLAVEENKGLRITEAGRSVLRALEALNGPHAESHLADQTQSLKAIDDLIGAGARHEMCNLGLGPPAKSISSRWKEGRTI